MIAAVATLRRRRRIAGIAFQPFLDYVVIELLRPQHPGKALAHDVLRIGGEILRESRCVEFVGFALALREDPVEICRTHSCS